jgi:hypothetical protein
MERLKICAPDIKNMSEVEKFVTRIKWQNVANLYSQKDIIIDAIINKKKPIYNSRDCGGSRGDNPICSHDTELFIANCANSEKTIDELYNEVINFALADVLAYRNLEKKYWERCPTRGEHVFCIIPCVQELIDKLVELPFFMRFKIESGIYQEFNYLQVVLSLEDIFDISQTGVVVGFGRKNWLTTFNHETNITETKQISG